MVAAQRGAGTTDDKHNVFSGAQVPGQVVYEDHRSARLIHCRHPSHSFRRRDAPTRTPGSDIIIYSG